MNRTLSVLFGLLLPACPLSLPAQLAITEAMSQAGLETDPGYSRPDYWELTNFGTNAIPLDGYSFSDSRRTDLRVYDPFTNLVIHAGESIIFFRAEPNRSSVTNAERFRQWWGESNLPPNLQIRTYLSPGLDGQDHDELWVYDPQVNVIDSVFFGQAWVGHSFTVEPDSGVFGVFSVAGVNGAFPSALGNDIGSPGQTVPAASIRITGEPANTTVDFGDDATFSVSAVGLPRPKYQWYKGSSPISGATFATLTLSNVTLADARADYYVYLYNGVQDTVSYPVALTVNTNPTPPTIITPPVNISVFSNQTATFQVAARGFPIPSYQWYSNGVLIPGAVSRILNLPAVQPNMSGVTYSVHVGNSQGTTNLAALLTVAPRPKLRFTEVMPSPIFSDSSSHFNWFELTNFDTNTVDLLGYRFFDTPTFVGAFTISAPLSIKPGESIVFVEHMTPAQFWAWWGQDNYRPDIQIVTFNGFSLADTGEQLFLWNPGATDPYDTVADTSWPAATRGVSMECDSWCDDTYGCVGSCMDDSIAGLRGAWHAQSNGDIGSPGYLANPPLRIFSLTDSDESIDLRCRVTPGKSYRFYRATTLVPSSWQEVRTYLATDTTLVISEPKTPGEPALFYRLEQLP